MTAPPGVDAVGEVAALGLLLEQHRAGMRAVALSILGPGPDADDAVQDAALTALRGIGDVRDPAAVGAWLRMIVRNRCRDMKRAPSLRQPRARAAHQARPGGHRVDTAAVGDRQTRGSGPDNKQIGKTLFLSPRTVSTHLYQLFPKRGAPPAAAAPPTWVRPPLPKTQAKNSISGNAADGRSSRWLSRPRINRSK